MRKITTPLTKSVRTKFKCGEELLLTGTVYTARDQAHKKLVELIIENFPEYKRPNIIHLADRHGEVKYAWTTFQKSVDLLGYKETCSIEEAIKRMSKWAKQQGPQDWTEEKLSIVNEKVPETWTMERNIRRMNDA